MKRIQRLLSILLVCCMMLSCLPATALANEVRENEYTDTEDEMGTSYGDINEIQEGNNEYAELEPVPGSSAVRPDDISLEDLMPLWDDVPSFYASEGENDSRILLIQSTIPWRSNANTIVLDSLKADGYLGAYDTVSMTVAANTDFSAYNVIMLANDQTADTYSQYELIRGSLERYVNNGGVVLFGACDNGWAEGQLSASSLPFGVTKYKDYSYYNYIDDFAHPVVTGDLTGGAPLTDSLLYHNYCSHTTFNEDSLPSDAHVIIRSRNTSEPTLVEYPHGNGRVILSGLTWEHSYDHKSNGFARTSYDDLIVYALTKSRGYSYSPAVYEFNYNQNEPYSDLAKLTSLYSLLAYRQSVDNNGKWVANGSVAKGTIDQESDKSKAALGKELQKAHFVDLYSYNYDEQDTNWGGVLSKQCEKGEHSICYTIGHRRVSINGSVQDQIVVVFRGTDGKEWYGNFDVSGVKYNPDTTHRSFLAATNSALTSLGKYVSEFSDRLNAEDGLSILVTGHSRGAAVANLFAHSLNGDPSRYGKSIASIYAYTYATPNVASYDKIKESPEDQNIFNYCFTDDFVPNLPLESWTWGKYGRTYWATAADLDYTTMGSPIARFLFPVIIYPPETDSPFRAGTKAFFGESPNYNTNHTKAIVKSMKKLASSVENYYDTPHIYSTEITYGGNQTVFAGSRMIIITPVQTYHTYMTSYRYMRDGIGGSQQGLESGTKVISDSLFDNDFSTLSWHFATGGLVGYWDWKVDPSELVMTGELNYTHQAGSYYVGMEKCFGDFKYSAFNNSGYDATPYMLTDGVEVSNADRAVSLDDAELAAMQSFLGDYPFDFTDSKGTTKTINNVTILGWDPDDPSTWEGITVEEGHVTAIDLQGKYLHGEWDLSGFGYLREVNVGCNSLTALNFSGCHTLEQVECYGNQLEKLDLTGCTALTYLDCEQNHLRELDLGDCEDISSLFCNTNYLSEINIPRNVNDLVSISYENQSTPADADFSANDVEKLTALATQSGNSVILQWNLDAPETWNGVKWVPVEGIYYVNEIDLRDLGLGGTVDLSNCRYLETLLISNNDFTGLNVSGCGNLNTLWCAYNYLGEEDLQGTFSGASNLYLRPQKVWPNGVLSSSDVTALNDLISGHGLNWETSEAALRSNPALTWALSDGVYKLTGLDLSGTDISGSADLLRFASLKSFSVAGTPIRTVSLPESISVVNDYAFLDCSNLATVFFAGKAPFISDNAFDGFDSVPRLVLSFDGMSFEDVVYMLKDSQCTLGTSHFPDGSLITWVSSIPSVATVSGGIVTMLSEAVGSTALISADATSGIYTFTATCLAVTEENNLGPLVTFDANGGSVTPAMMTTDEEGRLAELPTPVRDGYTFDGWFTAPDGGDEVTTDTVFTEDTMVYAHWTQIITPPEPARTYTVTVYGGTGGGDYEIGEDVTITAIVPEGMRFRLWTVDEGDVTLADPYSEVTTFTMPAGDVTVTANYEDISTPPEPARTYTVTVNGGTGGGNYEAGETVTITAIVPEGMRFRFWTVDEGDVTLADPYSEVTTFTMPASDVTVSATYEDVVIPPVSSTYQITFDANGGTVTPVAMTTDEEGRLAWLPVPVRGGYDFDGWFTAPAGGYRVTVNTVFTDDAVVYARWTYINDFFDENNWYPPAESTAPTTYRITAPDVSGGTVSVSPKSAAKGRTVTLTVTADEGYELAKLTVTDSRGNELELTDMGDGRYTFIMPDSAVTVSAVFKLMEQQPAVPTVPDWVNPFTDVSVSAWYYDAVKFVNTNSLMNGIENNLFAPDANLSRAQLAQILYNKEGRPAVSGGSAFTDVAASAWYSDAVTWAAAKKIVGGYGNGLFGPEDNITREQLAVMLWRYAGEPDTNGMLTFHDAGQTSSYALTAMCWAVEKGIINGKGDGILDPKGLATRAQVAQMLKNYLDI